MKPSLQVRLSQHLALTPQLQQSIRLLQLSTLELHQEVEQMLEQNPFLEPEEGDDAPAGPPVERPSALEREDAAGDSPDGDAAPEVSAAEFGTTEREDWENGTEGDDFDGISELPSAGGGQGEDDEF
ncbi:MAG: RNA polymerase factor sigma-54, partial [Rubrivivax sp.]|nr:RNA polymerase factor sigma-54 [Rubrivivax sp.]